MMLAGARHVEIEGKLQGSAVPQTSIWLHTDHSVNRYADDGWSSKSQGYLYDLYKNNYNNHSILKNS